jgi:outer membrane lipoprotein-sorting protein
MLRRPLRTALVLSAALAMTALRASADDPLPKAEEVLDKYVEATGGKAAYEKLKNRVAKGTMEIVGAGLKGKLVAYQAPPNKMRTEVEFENLGKIVEGSDGNVVWEVNPITGDRAIEGDEKAEKLLHNTFNGELRWKEMYAKAECTGVEDVNGKPAYKVVLTPKPGAGKPSTEFYDKASHLQVKSLTTAKTPMGELEVEMFPSDYKKVDDVLIAHKVTQKLLTQEIAITMTEIKHNVDLPPDTFKVPDAIKPLLEKKKDEK